MKRLLCILLILALSLPGCAFKKNRMQEPVTFYYLHKHETEDHYDTFFASGAIGSELREAANHRDNLPYLLALYLLGPTSAELDLPFPTGTKLQKIHLRLQCPSQQLQCQTKSQAHRLRGHQEDKRPSQ